MRSRHMSPQLADMIGAFEQHNTCCATSQRFSCAATFDYEYFSFDNIQAGRPIEEAAGVLIGVMKCNNDF